VPAWRSIRPRPRPLRGGWTLINRLVNGMGLNQRIYFVLYSP
jgi:hypothetical protein